MGNVMDIQLECSGMDNNPTIWFLGLAENSGGSQLSDKPVW